MSSGLKKSKRKEEWRFYYTIKYLLVLTWAARFNFLELSRKFGSRFPSYSWFIRIYLISRVLSFPESSGKFEIPSAYESPAFPSFPFNSPDVSIDFVFALIPSCIVSHFRAEFRRHRETFHFVGSLSM